MSAVRDGAAGLAAFVALVVAIVVSVTMLIWLAAHGRPVPVVFPFAVAAWGCYMGGHYLVEGEFIDESETGGGGGEATGDGNDAADGGRAAGRSNPLPSSPTRLALVAGGVGAMVLTFPAGIVAVGSGDFALLLVSATLFVGGYMVGHQGLLGKPL